MEGGAGSKLRGVVGEGLEDRGGPVGAVNEQQRKGLLEGGKAIVILPGVAVDAIQKRSQIDELVTRIDELQVEEVLLARHCEKVSGGALLVNGEGRGGKSGWWLGKTPWPPSIRPMARAIPPEILLNAYAHGVFPMAEDGEIFWFSPERRGLIPLDDRFHIPHGLRRALRRRPFEVRWNTAFRDVMRGCAERSDTWIDPTIIESYCALHRDGHAHSVECWDGEGLQGGLYGVALPGVFFGESMFSRKTDASKIALAALVERLRLASFSLLDTQWMTQHLTQFGGYEMSRGDYLSALGKALKDPQAGRL